jgi:hypothetical protein
MTQGFSDNSRLRASDAERDQAASVINTALAEGRLTPDEHSERLDAVFAAKTHADIVPILDDLPGQDLATRAPARSPAPVSPTGVVPRIVAIFSGASRSGRWDVDPVTEVTAVFGGVELDLRDAILPGNEITIKATAVFGGVEITIPPEMRVVDTGTAILGGRDISGNSEESMDPDAPLLRITGTCVLGGVEVKRKKRKTDKTGWRRALDV